MWTHLGGAGHREVPRLSAARARLLCLLVVSVDLLEQVSPGVLPFFGREVSHIHVHGFASSLQTLTSEVLE